VIVTCLLEFVMDDTWIGGQ